MVEIGSKPDTARLAVARGRITLKPETLDLTLGNRVKKGDVLTVSQIVGTQVAKRAHEMISILTALSPIRS